MDNELLRARLVSLVIEAGGGAFTEQELATAGGSLRSVNYSSLSFMRLIDAIENEFGVFVDPDADIERFATLDGLNELVLEGMDAANA